jgi:hypothetical protein
MAGGVFLLALGLWLGGGSDTPSAHPRPQPTTNRCRRYGR